MKRHLKIGFFGTPDYAVTVLEALKIAGHDIVFIVTQPDRPQGRKMLLTSPPAKIWGENHGVTVYQPEKLADDEFVKTLSQHECDVFVVIAYGKIIPKNILEIPPGKALNIHGSLLPKLRGASPIETSILNDDRETGVSIIRMNEKMDEGPVIAEQEVMMPSWPPRADVLGKTIVAAGAALLVSILPDWVAGKIAEKRQDESKATYTQKIKKEDGLIDLADDPYQNYLKIQAYHGWPTAYFFKEINGIKTRIKITDARYENGTLVITKVIPEGRSEMPYASLQ